MMLAPAAANLSLLSENAVRLEVAAAGERRRIEVDDHRALLQSILQRKLNSLPASEAGAVKSGALSPSFSAARAG